MRKRLGLVLCIAACSPDRPSTAPAPLAPVTAPSSAASGPSAPAATSTPADPRVEIALGDGIGGDWGTSLDDMAWSLRIPIQRCYASALRQDAMVAGWLIGEMNMMTPDVTTLHIRSSEGLPAELVACIASSCGSVPVGGHAGYSMTLHVYASLRPR